MKRIMHISMELLEFERKFSIHFSVFFTQFSTCGLIENLTKKKQGKHLG